MNSRAETTTLEGSTAMIAKKTCFTASFETWRTAVFIGTLSLALGVGVAGCGAPSPESELAEARQLLDKKDSKAAEIHLKNVLQQQPDNAEARYLLGESYLARYDFLSAEKELRRAHELKFDPDKVLPPLAKAMIEIGKFDQVLSDLDGGALKDPKSRALLEVYRGRALLAKGKPVEAKASFELALEIHPDLAEAAIATARVRAAERDLEGAEKLVDKVLAANAADADALMLKAAFENARSRSDEARALLESAVASSPEYAEPRVALAGLLLQMARYEDARKAIAELRKLPAGGFTGQLLLAQVELQERKFPAARDAIAQVLKRAPNHVPALMISGVVDFALGSFDRAEVSLRKVLAAVPGSIYARKVLAATLLRQGRADEADEVLVPLIRANVQDPAVFALAGDIAVAKRDPALAKKYFSKAVQIAPKDAMIRTALAASEMRMGERDIGIAELEKAVELDSGVYRADVMLVQTHLRDKQWDKALQAVKGLEKKQPNNPLTYNLAAAAYLGKKDVKSARAQLEKAVQLQATYMPAVLNLVQLDLMEKKPDEARKRLEAVLAKSPENPTALTAMARLRASQGANREEVGALLEKAQKGNPDQLQPRLALTRFYIEGRDYPKALALAQETQVKFPGNADALDLLGNVQLVSGDKRQALQTFRKLVAEHGKQPLAHVHLARAQTANDDVDGARKSYRQALEIAPRDAQALVGLIQLEVQAGRPGEALKIAQNLQKTAPKNPAGHIFEGDILLADKKPALAAASYRKALAIQKAPPVAVKLHVALVASGKKAEADAFASEWLKGNPDDPAMVSYLAQRKLAAKDWEGAKADYRAIVEKHPRNAMALNNLAWASLQTKDPKALEYAQRAAELAPGNVAVLDTLAMSLAETESDGKRALETFQKALALSPNADGVRFHYAQTLAKFGRKPEAKKELEALLGSGRKFASEQAARDLLSTL